MDNQQCMGLTQVPWANDVQDCIDACCADPTCATYQWCPPGSTNCNPAASCWIGAAAGCQAAPGWVSRGRNASGPPPPGPGPAACTDPACQPGTDDSTWRSLSLPHDFVVEGTFSPSADKSHGYLPFGAAWYRRHLTIPSSLSGATLYIDLEGAQTKSTVYLNGALLGQHNFGYTPSRYFLNNSQVNFDKDNVLAVFVDATAPDGCECLS